MPQPKTILLAEDDENDVILIQRAFAEAGVSEPIHVVRDGAQAVAYLGGDGEFADRRQHPFPCLLLLDLEMGRRSGLTVLRWLRDERPDLRKRLSVVVLSAVESAESLKTAYDLGANSYLVKPFAFQRLIALAGAIKSYWLDLNHLPEE